MKHTSCRTHIAALPTFDQLPTAIFPYLSAGLYMMGNGLVSHPEMFDDFAEFEFAEVGRDGITRRYS